MFDMRLKDSCNKLRNNDMIYEIIAKINLSIVLNGPTKSCALK